MPNENDTVMPSTPDGGSLSVVGGSAPWLWCYAAVCALAVKLLEEDNRTCGDNWPAGQSWGELGGSSKSIYLTKARELAGIPHAEFLAIVRSDSDAVEEIYERGSALPNNSGQTAGENQQPTA